jgi:hypothetical protein
LFASQKQLRLGERDADLVEHECVKGVGADVAFRAAAVLAAGADRVVVAAVVVAVSGAVAAAHCVAVGAHPAHAALDQAFEQPLTGFGATRAPLAVVAGDSPGGLKHFVGDDAGAGDGNPLVAVAGHLAAMAGGPVVRYCLGAVVVDPTDVGLVAQ